MPSNREIIESLLEAFPDRPALGNFLYTRMAKPLDHISGDGNLESIMVSVVVWARGAGRLQELFDKATEDKPHNVRLRDVSQRLPANIAVMELDPNESIRALLSALEVRSDLFRFTNAYKQLHEIVHKLYRSRSRILNAVHARMNATSQPLAEDVIESLKDWISRARDANSDTEFPERVPKWIMRMETSLAILTDSDPGRWDWAFQRLDSIPADEMGPLNDRLVDNAARLRCNELVEYSQLIMASLEGQLGVEIGDTMRRVEKFGKECKQLAELVETHNDCQQIDQILGQAGGLPEIFPEALMDWSDALSLLQRTKDRSRDNPRIQEACEAAEHFVSAKDSAIAAKEYWAMKAFFDDFFTATDEQLLKVSNRIGTAVFGLASKLRAIL